ncbi:MAG: site-2 protease family protein [Solirubrobacterales bacterium]|nr:site-2 protease family protein [Solirubrobacterales bacterium]
MNESLHLGQIRGIRIGINWSLLPIFLVITWSLASTLLPAAAPGYVTSAYWMFGAVTAAAFYASLLAHELAHALVARRHGVNVKGIVLWVFGGVAQLENDSPDPRAELELTAAGPATSLALAGAGLGLAWLLGSAGASPLLVSSVAWLGGINGLLALFNLLPAFPLDGGRILRALLWWRWRDRARATAVAAKVGKAGGFVLIGVGVLGFLFGGGALGGLWLALIGWFIIVAARQQHERIGSQPRAGELRVADAMTREPVTVSPAVTVAEVIEHYIARTRFSAFPVVDAGGRLVGLATVQRTAQYPRDQWQTTPVTAASAATFEIVQCRPQDQLAEVTIRLQSSRDRRAIVLENGRVVGILTPSDARRAISHAQLFGKPWSTPDRGSVPSGPGEAAGGIPARPVPQP